jgi:hypothetical protein
MIRNLPLAFALSVMVAAPSWAQTAAPGASPGQEAPDAMQEPSAPPAPKTMVGTWELSNADREKICTITLRNDPAKIGKRVEFDAGCAGNFGFVRDIVSWQMSNNDFLRLLDAQGNSVLEFSEVESGIFEAPKPGEGILFIQNPTDLGPAPKTVAQVTGEWSVTRRTGKAICGLTLSNTPVGEEFAVQAQPGCDPVVTRFAPSTWTMDRGEIVLHSASGQFWRFEEGDGGRWPRVPATGVPLFMTRK